MPRNNTHRNNGSNGRTRGGTWSGDVTLNDFANSSSAAKNRIRKSLDVVGKNVEKLSVAVAAGQDDLDWFDKDEFDFDLGEGDEETSGEQSVKLVRSSGGRNHRRRKKLSPSADATSEGKVYSDDVWFALGRYISPENVGRFAAICKGAYRVTQASNFWTRLYKRYYTDLKLELLPEALEPEQLQRMHGLRTRVIRSMFYLYEPMADAQFGKAVKVDPNILRNRTCTKMWNQKMWGRFDYYFKLKDWSDLKEDDGPKSQMDLINSYGDIQANREKGCKILHVMALAPAYIPPTIYGQTFLLSSRSGARYGKINTFCLDLIFGPPHALQYMKKGRMQSTNIPEGAITVSLDYAVMTKVLDWWDPFYPQEGEIDPIAAIMPGVPEEEDSEEDDETF